MSRSAQSVCWRVPFGAGALACCLFALTALLSALPVCPARAYASSETYLLLADTHLGQPGQANYEEVEDALLWAGEFDNLRAVAVAGDLTDRGAEAAYSEWEFLCESILGPGVARMQAMGDHDTGHDGLYLPSDSSLTVENCLAQFRDINGGALTSYAEFEHANIMTVGGVWAAGHATITASMLKELNSRLKKTARQGKMAVVVCHYPYYYYALSMRSKLQGILRSYPNVIFVSGHLHKYSSRASCQRVAPACQRTPFSRAGYSKSTRYSFTSVGVNALSSTRSGGDCYADTLQVNDSGRIVVRKWNLSEERVERVWRLKQAKSSVTVKAGSSAGARGSFTYRVVFSDGGRYGKVKSGGTFTLKAGAQKRFSNVPAGVLVTVRPVAWPQGTSAGLTKRAEVGKSPRTLVMAVAQAKRNTLRAAS